MQQPIHALAGRRREMTPERVAGLGFVGLLHVVAIWAILTGLVPKIVQVIKHDDLVLVRTREKEVPPPPMSLKPPPRIPTVTLSMERRVAVPPPVIDIARDPPPVTGDPTPPKGPPSNATPSVPDTAAFAVTGTHTTPAYPLLERRLDHQGTVKLRLTISAEGAVTGAQVAQSSGYPGLDQAAVSWVILHWRYKPATHDGAPAASTTVAAVVFNIKNAGQ
jgi:protein TonB